MKREDGTSPAEHYVLEEETLAQLQPIFEKEKNFFDDKLDKLFPLIKKNKGSKFPDKVLDNRTPRAGDRKRKHADSDRSTTQDKWPCYDGKWPAHQDRAKNTCRHCEDTYLPGHLGECDVFRKKRENYMNKDNGSKASKYAPKNYTDTFSQRRRSFEEKLHNGDNSNKRIHHIETSEQYESVPSQTSGAHPTDEVTNELLQDDNFFSPFKRALKQVKEKRHDTQGNVYCLALKRKEDANPIMNQSPYSLHTPFLLNNNRLMTLADTGADISFIGKQIVNKLNVNPTEGLLLLADMDKPSKRLGVTDKMNVGYKGQTIVHEFEVLNMNNEIDAIFGRDILPKLGIHLVGVATNWDDNKVV
ncbi:hypothetical protein RMATCC62417_10729 [Rhizopus microsporus]|nr:hypothetical protein RMATCC62417_10729 [Rhizopus microsporus]